MRLQLNLQPKLAVGILAGLVQVNLQQITEAGAAGKFPVTSGLRNGTIRYIKADPLEDWKDWSRVLADGGGDCEDLVAAVAAEAMAAGIQARPVAYEAAPDTWHVVVEIFGSGGKSHYGDPSLLGGMRAVA